MTKPYTFRRALFNSLGFFVAMGFGAVALAMKGDVIIFLAVVLGVTMLWMKAERKIFGRLYEEEDAVDEKFWLQHADGRVEAVKEQSRDGVLLALAEFDWEGELAKERELGKKAAVPPSLGLGTFGEGHFLNIMPRGGGVAEVLYVCERAPAGDGKGGKKKKKKPKTEETLKENFDLGKAGSIVDAYFTGEWEKIGRMLK